MKQLFAQAMVIARRDFTSIVVTPTFIIFLLMPLVMIAVSGASGVGAASLASQTATKTRIVAIAGGDDAARLVAADQRLRAVFGGNGAPPSLTVMVPEAKLSAQSNAIMHDDAFETRALLSGPLSAPTISYGEANTGAAKYLTELSQAAMRNAKAGAIAEAQLTKPKMVPIKAVVANANSRQGVGVAAVFAIFLLTLLLAGQTVGTLAEERSNKVIEIMAAAVRVEAIFIGKLVGMFGVALVFIGFWTVIIGIGIQFVPAKFALSGLQPAIGLPLFLLLCCAYFSMAFMLLGAVFLGIGSQASTMREIQMMTLPITMFQVVMFGLSSAAAGSPGSSIARIAQIFPFSSPFAMAARGATDPALWPHVMALVWQALWVGLTIFIASRLFRAGVLKAGGGWRGVLGMRRAPA